MPMIAFLSLFLAATPAATDQPSPAAAALPVAASPAKPKLICRDSQVTGSLVQREHRCGTAAEWAAAYENQRNVGRTLASTHASGILTD